MLILALGLFALLLFAALTIILKCRPMPVTGALPLAFCLFIAVETVLLNILSLFQGVTLWGMLLSHGVTLALWLIWRWKTAFPIQCVFRRSYSACRSLARKPAMVALAPVLLLLLFMLCKYPPTTWDSMTYHMARIVHWMQNQSIDYYFTSISRQNRMGPGAEYLLLFFQVLTGTDYLATSVQFIAFLLLPGAYFYLLRTLKVLQCYHSPIVLLTLTAPMLLFQATTTQNDVVAALAAVATIISAVRIFAGRIEKLSTADFALFGLCLAVGFLVKPTAILVSLPLIGVLCLLRIGELLRNIALLLRGTLIAIGFLAITAGPDIYRKAAHPIDYHEVYKIQSGWTGNRLTNPVKMTFQHNPWPERTENLYRSFGIDGELHSTAFRLHNDLIGNPMQSLVLLFATLATLLGLPSLLCSRNSLPIKLFISIAPLFSWLAFGLMVKNNPWISRVQMPLFTILPISFVFISVYTKTKVVLQKCVTALLWGAAFFSLMLAFFELSHAEHRSLTARDFFSWKTSTPRESRYYQNRPELEKEHQIVRTTLQDAGCTRLGLLLGGDDWDYPLTWPLMNEKVQVRHIPDSLVDDWSCMLYAKDQKKIDRLAFDGQWQVVTAPYLWRRNSGAVPEK